MIVPMKKVSVICLGDEKLKALEELRHLGVLHVETINRPESSDFTNLTQQTGDLDQLVGILSGIKPTHDSGKFSNSSPKELAEIALKTIEETNDLKKKVENLVRDRDRLLPWGDFSPSLIKELSAKNIFVYLCEGTADDVKATPENASVKMLKNQKGKLFYAVISRSELDVATLPVVTLPENATLSGIEKDIQSCRDKIKDNNSILAELANYLEKIDVHRQDVYAHLEFIVNRDGMAHEGRLSYVQGYVPVPKVEALKSAATSHGWALLINDPDDLDQVPTLLKVPKIFRISKPIFNFIGIMPGYHEWDVSTCFLFFFTIFFGMIVGDAGYGAIFLVSSLLLKLAFKKNKQAQPPLNLFLVLCAAAFVWGLLTGTVFGIPTEKLPGFLRGWPVLSLSIEKDKNIQYICFLIAAVHLSFARLWQSLIALAHKRFAALGQLGWAMLIWGNFFTAVELIVFQGSFPTFAYYLYGIGFVLILLFGVEWTNVGEVMNFPFSIIGSFVDVLSYIRLFAVGLSTFYIANSFNNMGLMLLDVSPILIIFTVVVILFGHILNILLAFMGVLVHGIRLNTLEFSNHMQLGWLGTFYKPFKRQNHSED